MDLLYNAKESPAVQRTIHFILAPENIIWLLRLSWNSYKKVYSMHPSKFYTTLEIANTDFLFPDSHQLFLVSLQLWLWQRFLYFIFTKCYSVYSTLQGGITCDSGPIANMDSRLRMYNLSIILTGKLFDNKNLKD